MERSQSSRGKRGRESSDDDERSKRRRGMDDQREEGVWMIQEKMRIKLEFEN